MNRNAVVITALLAMGFEVFLATSVSWSQIRSTTFGNDWVQSHPFTISALTLRPSEPADAPFDLNKYTGAGMNSVLMWKPRESIIDVVNEANFPTIMHDLRGPKFADDTTQIGKDFITQYEAVIPSIEGWLVSDEPQIAAFGLVKEVMDFARSNYPDKLAYANMGGSGRPESSHYVDFFMHIIQPDLLSYNVYPFRKGETWEIFEGMAYVRYKAQQANIPYWTFIQSWADPSTEFGTARTPSESELRMQVFSHLGMGFTGIQYFTYDEAQGPAMVDKQNNLLQPLYSDVQQLNREVAYLGESLKLLKSTEVRFVQGKSIDPETQEVVGHVLRPTLGISAWDSPEEHAPYITQIQATSSGVIPNVVEGDLMIGHFVPALESFDDPMFENEVYFMIVNLLSNENADAADGTQTVRVDFDFQGTSINSLQRVNRSTGEVDVVPLTSDGGGMYYLELPLPGGTGELFKYNTGAPFIVGLNAAVQSADFDSDDDVDGRDFLIWQRGSGLMGNGTLSNGDANGDMDVNEVDLAIWQGQFGIGASVLAVPESTSLAMMVLGSLSLSLLRPAALTIERIPQRVVV